MDDDAEKLPPEGADPEDEDARTLQQMQQFVSLRTDLQSLASHLSLAPNLIQCARSPPGQPCRRPRAHTPRAHTGTWSHRASALALPCSET